TGGANFIVRGDPSDSANPGQNAEGTGSHTPNNAEETPGPSGLLARFKKTSSTTLQNKLSRKRPNASKLTHSLKVTLAKKRGDDFEFLKEKYITIGEDNCNVDSITRKTRVEFGNQSLVLFSSSGKEILDSEGTRELYFWKKPARKVFAATEEQKEEGSSPPSIPPKIDNIESNVQAILDLMKKKEENNTALFKALKEALECRVCRDPIVTPPLLYSNCCKQLITCKECIGRLGATPSCPNCRSPDLSTFPNHTFDAILPIMAALIANES
uniref:RING-type domain-containing protein n=2 Tax=Clytia hemisphaerica TaxID=252671 RepID=A0A7M5XCV6_9CNID